MMNSKLCVFAGVVAVLALVGPALADNITVQLNYGDGDDTFVFANEPDTNQNGVTLHRLRGGLGWDANTYLRFDLDDAVPIPEGHWVTSAELSIYWYAAATGVDVDVYGVKDAITEDARPASGWDVDTVTWNNTPFGNAIYNKDTTVWDSDFDAAKSDYIGSGTRPSTGNTRGSILTGNALRDFLRADSNGVVTFLLRTDFVGGTPSQFYAEEQSSWFEPQLILTTEVIPEPVTVGFLAIGLVAMLARKRR